MTSLPPEAFEYDFFADLERSLHRQGKEMEPAPFIRERWSRLRPMTPIELHFDPCATSLAAAAAPSASFPPVIGPITLKVGDEEAYWHAGDGGLYENSGIESLLLLYLKQLQVKRARRALVIAFDSSFPFSVGERRLLRRSLPFTLLTFDFSRIPSIMEERATTYQALFFRSLQLEGVFPDAGTMTVVVLRHTDAKWADDLSDLPPACGAERAQLSSPPGGAGAHRRDPHAPRHPVGMRSPASRRRGGQAGRRAPRGDSRIPEPPLSRPMSASGRG